MCKLLQGAKPFFISLPNNLQLLAWIHIIFRRWCFDSVSFKSLQRNCMNFVQNWLLNARHCVVCQLSCMLPRPSPVCNVLHIEWLLQGSFHPFLFLFCISFLSCFIPHSSPFSHLWIELFFLILLYFMDFYFGCFQSVCEYGCHLANENKNINHNHHKDNMIMLQDYDRFRYDMESRLTLGCCTGFHLLAEFMIATLSLWRHTITMWIQHVFLSGKSAELLAAITSTVAPQQANDPVNSVCPIGKFPTL